MLDSTDMVKANLTLPFNATVQEISAILEQHFNRDSILVEWSVAGCDRRWLEIIFKGAHKPMPITPSQSLWLIEEWRISSLPDGVV